MQKTKIGWKEFEKITEIEKETVKLRNGDILSGEYKIIKPLGEGGMGSVYLAEHFKKNSGTRRRQVAIKVLNNPDDMILRERFEKESDLSLEVQHPNIIVAHDIKTHEGNPYLILAYVDGYDCNNMLENLFGQYREESPSELLKSFKNSKETHAIRPPDKVIAFIGFNIVDALDHAWKHYNLIHRDISPDNIMLQRKIGFPLLTDLGVATTSSNLVADGKIAVGKPWYISPEGVATPDEIDFRADQYSLGITLYEMIVGASPNIQYDQTTHLATHFSNIFYNSKSKLKRVDEVVKNVDTNLASIIEKMTKVNPADRYDNYNSLRTDFADRVLYKTGYGMDRSKMIKIMHYWENRKKINDWLNESASNKEKQKRLNEFSKTYSDHIRTDKEGRIKIFLEEKRILTDEAIERVNNGYNPCREIIE